MNFIPAVIRGGHIDAGDFQLPIPAGNPAAGQEGKSVVLGIRPEEILDAALPSNVVATAENTIQAKVDVLEPLGYEYVAYIAVGKINLTATISNETKVKENQVFPFLINIERIHLFDAETEEAIR